MPTNLTNNTITSTYNQLLHVSDGPTSTLKTVYSGTGTATALQVSTLAVAVDNLQLDGNTISSTDTNGNIFLTPNGTGQVVLSNPNFTGTTTFTGTTVNGGNLRMTSNTLSSTNTNGNVVIAPNGTGDVQMDADTVRMGDSNVDATLTTNGTGDMIISTNSGTNSGIIRIFDGVNGNITLTPNGTGDVILSADTVQIGDSNVDATLTTSGTGDLILNTNSGTNSGVIRIYDGTNGDIDITPNGTGTINLSKVAITSGTVPFATLSGRAYASFYDAGTTDQTGSTTDKTAVKWATAAVAGAGITVASNSRITLAAAGTYRVNISLQLNNAGASDYTVDVWFAKNGTNIANSNGRISVPKLADGGTILLAYEIFETVAANDYIEAYWYPQSTDVTLHYRAAVAANPGVTPAIPVTPPAIVVVERIA